MPRVPAGTRAPRIACARVTAILFVSYSGVLGGAERVLLDCADALPGQHVLACPDGPLAERARAAGLLVLPIPARSLHLRGGSSGRPAAAGRCAGSGSGRARGVPRA